MQAGCEMIMRGDTAEAVMKMLRESCKTVAALSVCISRIKSAIIPKLIMPTCAALYPYMLEPGVKEFIAMSLKEKLRIQRAHRAQHYWSILAEVALRDIQLLPPNVSGIKLDEIELISLSRIRDRALICKQDVIHVYAAGAWLEHIISLVLSATTQCPFPLLAIPLLILSGRRCTEIMNGKSVFAPSSCCTTTCVFTGQLKRRGGADAYEIPLLCDYNVFAYGISVLREKQQGEILDPIACNNRYHKMLNAETARTCSQAKTVHAFRAMYAAYAFHLYSSKVTFNRAVMQILGHDKLEVSLSYNAWGLHDLEALYPAGCMGELPLEVS
jgi:hypothetical protein